MTELYFDPGIIIINATVKFYNEFNEIPHERLPSRKQVRYRVKDNEKFWYSANFIRSRAKYIYIYAIVHFAPLIKKRGQINSKCYFR